MKQEELVCVVLLREVTCSPRDKDDRKTSFSFQQWYWSLS